MAERRAAVIAKHVKLANEGATSCLVVVTDDINVVYFVVVGVGSVADKLSPARHFAGGEYIFCLTLPEDYPAKPPSLRAVTPNGVYDISAPKICISIGEFHAQDTGGSHGERGWRPVLGLRGFVQEVVNGLVFSEGFHGIGIHSPIMAESARESLAAESLAYNRRHYPEITRRYEELAAAQLEGIEGSQELQTDAHKIDLSPGVVEQLEDEIRRGTRISAAAGLLLGRRAA